MGTWRGSAVLYRGQGRAHDKMTFELRSETHCVVVWRENIPSRGCCKCKDPEAGMSLVGLRNSKESSVTGTKSGQEKLETWQGVRGSCWSL